MHVWLPGFIQRSVPSHLISMVMISYSHQYNTPIECVQTGADAMPSYPHLFSVFTCGGKSEHSPAQLRPHILKMTQGTSADFGPASLFLYYLNQKNTGGIQAFLCMLLQCHVTSEWIRGMMVSLGLQKHSQTLLGKRVMGRIESVTDEVSGSRGRKREKLLKRNC